MHRSRWSDFLERRSARGVVRRQRRAARRLATPRRYADRPPLHRRLAIRLGLRSASPDSDARGPGPAAPAPPLSAAGWALTLLVGIASAVGVVATGMAPTGGPRTDLVWLVALGVAVALAGAVAGRSVLVVAALVASVGAWGWWSIAGVVALVLAGGLGPRRPATWLPRWLAHSLSASLALQAIVRMPGGSWMPFGSTAVLATLVVGAIVVSGWRHSPRVARTVVGITAVVGLLALAVLGGPLWRLTGGGGDLVDGAALASAGVFERLDQLDASQADIAAAAQQLADVQRQLSSPLVAPLRFVPLAAQQIRALDTSAAVARDLLDYAGSGIALVDADALRPAPGQVDVVGVRALEAPLGELVLRLESAQTQMATIEPRWLIGPTRQATRALAAAITRALPATELAVLGARAVPELVGADEPQRWLVQLVEPETGRDQWLVAVASGGRLTPTDEAGVGGASGVPATTERFSLTAFPAAAQAAASGYEAATGQRIDAVVRLDPIGATAITAIGGKPVVSLVDSPREFLQALSSSNLAGPSDWATWLQTPYSERRILVWSANPTAEAFLRALRQLGQP